MVRLTISRYYTPSGRCIQRDYKNGTTAYYEELIQRIINEENRPPDTLDTLQQIEYFTKSGRIVYGGGGVTPDIYLAQESGVFSNEYYQTLNSAAIIQFAFNYATQNNITLTTKYPSAKAFIKNMTVTNAILNDYLNFYSQKTSNKLPILNYEEKNTLSKWIKAFIGRNLYQDEAFYPIINEMDEVINEALKAI